jgi:dihydrofolate synthase/folylpolyglutamate synthase
MDRLGDTVTAIARQKAAIIEPGDLAVTGATGDGLAVVRRRCIRFKVPLTIASPAPILGWDRDALQVELPGLGPTSVGLRGRHQAANVAVADSVLDALEVAGIATASPDARRRGYADARWAGRLELLHAEAGGRTREVLLDGAHNPDGAAALAQALDDLAPHLVGGTANPPRPPVLVWASMADKDVASMLRALAASALVARATVICTALEVPRALPAADLGAAWRAAMPGAHVLVEGDSDRALDLALVTGDGPVVVAGSLYLVGAARARLVDDPALRDPVAAPVAR